MEKNFENLAVDYFKNGYSCSESIAQAAVDLGLTNKDLVSVATSFSGGMSSGCLCGAVAGAQMIIGLLYGKYKNNTARAKAKEFYDKFTSVHKVTCCKVLTKDFKDFHSPERRNHCINMVQFCAKTLDEMLEKEKEKI
ncbi:MAG: C_GCAxxG_C_C family protein [Candidatus Gastranaerophilales bacterium]|nr:C_GCAxxG_C_C family protein [Candidatus Gastranaerophilales bacterium]